MTFTAAANRHVSAFDFSVMLRVIDNVIGQMLTEYKMYIFLLLYDNK